MWAAVGHEARAPVLDWLARIMLDGGWLVFHEATVGRTGGSPGLVGER